MNEMRSSAYIILKVAVQMNKEWMLILDCKIEDSQFSFNTVMIIIP